MGKKIFYRKWTEYEIGFGSPSSEVWLGKVDLLYNSYISNNFLFIR